MSKGRREKSIRTKLVQVFVIVSIVVFVVNFYIYYSLNRTIREIDSVYTSNIRLNDLSSNLDRIQQSLYEYLNTKSSDSLESYYMYEQDYYDMLEQLNTKTVSNETALMEKNIYNMSVSYLEKTGETVDAKRGRNVAKYNKTYGEAERIYEYLQANVDSMNMTVFLQNSSNYSELRTVLNFLIWLSIFLLCGVMAVAIGWIILMTRNITKPLIELANAANEIAMGNMEVDFPIVETKDEVSTVAKACNKMIDNIRAYIQKTKENYERENKLIENELIMKTDLKEAQLKYLQAQIDPHFLFNSLNAASQLAMMEGAERACMFIENMADFFRYNVRKIDEDVTLQEELDLADNYIYIMNVRYAGEIHYHKQIDERLVSVYMPSMILQPIIENAVKHGIQEMEGNGEIRVSVYSDGTHICIDITDNGKGIAPEAADKIMRGESAQSHREKDATGIGMDNVRNRLCRYYNVEHVLDIKRLDIGGTKVTIYIPGKGGERPDD